jgi:hypothetical protein
VPAAYKVYVDWTGNGTFTDPGDDVTSRTLDGRTPLVIRYGRDQARALSPTSPGEVNLELNNISRDYSPENSSSPLAGRVLPGRDVYIKATLAGTDYAIFNGQLDDFTVKPNLEERSIDVVCLDALGRLRGVEVSTELYSGIRTGEAIGRLLDAAGWSATARDLDVGATVMPWWWADAEDCFDAVMKLVASEGPPALITSDGNGNVVFRDRHHRLLHSASLTVQSTWRSSGSVGPVLSTPAVYNHGWKEIVNVLDFEVPLRRPADPPSVVWNSQDRISLAAGETVTLTARSSDPFYNAIVPVQDTDYTLVSGAPQISLTRSSGQSTTVTILAVGVAAIIDGLQVRATTVPTVTTVVVHAEDSTSISSYGRRSAPDGLVPVWAPVFDAQAIQELILARRADRVPTDLGDAGRRQQHPAGAAADSQPVRPGARRADADRPRRGLPHRADPAPDHARAAPSTAPRSASRRRTSQPASRLHHRLGDPRGARHEPARQERPGRSSPWSSSSAQGSWAPTCWDTDDARFRPGDLGCVAGVLPPPRVQQRRTLRPRPPSMATSAA